MNTTESTTKKPFESKTKVTTWENNTDKTVSFKISDGEVTRNQKAEPCGVSRLVDVVIGPGESVEILSVFDSAVRTTNKAGVICGGLAPYLSKQGEVNPPDFVTALKPEKKTTSKSK
jgi:hypothetical protein